MSKSITSPNVSRLYGLLVEQLDTLIFELDHPPQDFVGMKMSSEQAKVLRHTYIVMKENLLKYDS